MSTALQQRGMAQHVAAHGDDVAYFARGKGAHLVLHAHPAAASCVRGLIATTG